MSDSSATDIRQRSPKILSWSRATVWFVALVIGPVMFYQSFTAECEPIPHFEQHEFAGYGEGSVDAAAFRAAYQEMQAVRDEFHDLEPSFDQLSNESVFDDPDEALRLAAQADALALKAERVTEQMVRSGARFQPALVVEYARPLIDARKRLASDEHKRLRKCGDDNDTGIEKFVVWRKTESKDDGRKVFEFCRTIVNVSETLARVQQNVERLQADSENLARQRARG